MKAAIQNAVARLPSAASYEVYYQIQRRFGQLRHFSPVSRLRAGADVCQRIRDNGRSPRDMVFFEVGTGRVPVAPIAYWLMGAKKVITTDLNPYLKKELIRESIRYMTDHQDEVRGLFHGQLDEARFESLLGAARDRDFDAQSLLQLCGITYVAPGDAGDTRLPDRCIDVHTSYTVLEHIPPEELRRIFLEGNRITTPDGLFVHMIDYSDHFSHSDSAISAINFLQYGDEEWRRYAGNRYMYMNRLRHDDLLELLASVGHRLLAADVERNERARAQLAEGGVTLDGRFASKARDILEITGAWLVSEKA